MVISTQMSEVGEEKFNGQFHNGALTDLAYCTVLKHAVVAGPTGIKVHQYPVFVFAYLAMFSDILGTVGGPF